MNLLMVESDDEDIDLDSVGEGIEVRHRPIDMPISIDELYNLIVCKDCGIGLPLNGRQRILRNIMAGRRHWSR